MRGVSGAPKGGDGRAPQTLCIDATRASALPFHRRLHVRIGAVVLLVLVSMALCLLLLSRGQQQRLSLEVAQRLNLGLARYVMDHQSRPLLASDGQPDRPLLMDMAMYVMRANPAVEVYLLDPNGNVIGHALDGTTVPMGAVDLGPVRALLDGGDRTELPALGDDPAAPGQRNIFSVARIGDAGTAARGYLYIVLRGKAAAGLAEGPMRSRVMRDTTLAVLLAAGVASLALLVSLVALTRPLRRLTEQAQSFRRDGGIGNPGDGVPTRAAATDEIGVLASTMAAMQARIAEQFKQVDASDRLRRELVSNLSHDLQTPLTSIQGYAEHCLLKNDVLMPHERAHALRVLLRHCASLARRIGDLFELSKLDAGRVQPKLEVFCLAELLQDIVDGYQVEASARQVALGLSASSQSTEKVRADIALIERVFQNLIDNALRHTPPGGTVTIGVALAADRLRVSVADTGSGIAEAHLAHVFERYFQAENYQAENYQAENYAARDTAPVGTGPSAGLGLAIVKRILELHGSAIRVSSELARGTRFDFSLPRAAG